MRNDNVYLLEYQTIQMGLNMKKVVRRLAIALASSVVLGSFGLLIPASASASEMGGVAVSSWIDAMVFIVANPGPDPIFSGGGCGTCMRMM